LELGLKNEHIAKSGNEIFDRECEFNF